MRFASREAVLRRKGANRSRRRGGKPVKPELLERPIDRRRRAGGAA